MELTGSALFLFGTTSIQETKPKSFSYQATLYHPSIVAQMGTLSTPSSTTFRGTITGTILLLGGYNAHFDRNNLRWINQQMIEWSDNKLHQNCSRIDFQNKDHQRRKRLRQYRCWSPWQYRNYISNNANELNLTPAASPALSPMASTVESHWYRQRHCRWSDS